MRLLFVMLIGFFACTLVLNQEVMAQGENYDDAFENPFDLPEDDNPYDDNPYAEPEPAPAPAPAPAPPPPPPPPPAPAPKPTPVETQQPPPPVRETIPTNPIPPAPDNPTTDAPRPADDKPTSIEQPADDPNANPFDNPFDLPEDDNPYAEEGDKKKGNSNDGGGKPAGGGSKGDDNPYAGGGDDEDFLPPLIGLDTAEVEVNTTPLVPDGIYEKQISKERKALEYDHIREADVFWQKRVWRVIDTDQKMNQVFAYPKEPLISVLLEIIEKYPEDTITFMYDDFTVPKTIEDLDKELNNIDTILVEDPITEKEYRKVVKNDFNWMDVKKFRIKEDWVFDEESSRMEVRILAITPIMDKYDEGTGMYMGVLPLFHVYYPTIREDLVNYEVFNEGNDANRLSWEDLLRMRYFSSYIMKESNLQDLKISEFLSGRDALLEAERVKKEIFEMEQNLWSY